MSTCMKPRFVNVPKAVLSVILLLPDVGKSFSQNPSKAEKLPLNKLGRIILIWVTCQDVFLNACDRCCFDSIVRFSDELVNFGSTFTTRIPLLLMLLVFFTWKSVFEERQLKMMSTVGNESRIRFVPSGSTQQH